MRKSKYKIGDKVICIRNTESLSKPGVGWEEGKILIIKEISFIPNKDNIIWPKPHGDGIREPYIRLYDIIPKEMFIL